jgi:hypothetical protein
MYGILVSAFNYALGWIFRVLVIKAMVFGLLFYITSEFMGYLMGKLSGSAIGGMQGAVDGLPGGVLWALGVMRADFGIPLVLASAGLAFSIRRIPVIG